MKLHVLSDVHLEFQKWRKQWDIASIDCDVHVLAGDIGVGLSGIAWALEAFEKPVIYVFGNHEYYGPRTMLDLFMKARDKVAGSHVHLLENEQVVIGGVRFLGSTLWTDFALFGEDQQAKMMTYAHSLMSDYANIPVAARPADMPGQGETTLPRKDTRLTPQMVLAKHLESRDYLERALADKRHGCSKTVVVSHHAPHPGSLLYEEPMSRADAAYASHLGHLVAQADLWIHGHVHVACDYALEVGGRVVSNCRGYRDTGPGSVGGFAWNRVIEL